MKVLKIKNNIVINGSMVLQKGIYDLANDNLIVKYPFIDFTNEEYFEISNLDTIKIGSVVKYDNKFWYVMEVNGLRSRLSSAVVTYRIAKSKTDKGKDWKYVSGSDLTLCETYWFINSEGCLHEAIKGKNPRVDHFREMSGNVFPTKDDAFTKLNEILHSTSVTA